MACARCGLHTRSVSARRRQKRMRELGCSALIACLAHCTTPAEGLDREREPARANPAIAAEAIQSSPLGSADAPHVALELPELEGKRVAYLFESAALVAHAWPALKGEDTCVLLLAESMQWVLNCTEAPAGFTRTAQRFRELPVFARPGGKFDADGRALTTAELLALSPASAHVDEPGEQRSALPPRHGWLVLGSLDALRKYNAAFNDCSTEEWLSVAMHELLHACALRAPSFAASLRQINSHALDPKPLAELFDADANYHALVAHEYALLVDAAAHPPINPAQARRTLTAWAKLYRARRANLAARANGSRLIAADSLFTYVEGVARYVESTFLDEPSQHPSDEILGDPSFHSFARWESFGYDVMPNRQLDREYYYAIGFHLGLLLDHVDRGWKRAAQTHRGFLIGLALANAR
jgi:hypothetical protein